MIGQAGSPATGRGVRDAPGPGRGPREVEALVAVAAAVAGAHRLEDVLEIAAEHTRESVGAASVSISRWELDRSRLRTLVNVGDLGPGEERRPTDELYPLADYPLAVAVLKRGLPHASAVDDPKTDPSERALLAALGKEACAAVPIVHEGTTWGEMYAATAAGAHRLDDADVRFMQAICGQLSLAIARAELFSRVLALAYEDPLTGLANRRALEDRLDELQGAESGVCLLLGDVDGLKAVNDADGHDAGDAAIRAVAGALRRAGEAAGAACVARLSGDEFCVVLTAPERRAGRALAQRASAALADDGAAVSLSWGVAVAEPGRWRPGEVLRAADGAQYESKRRGGDRVCTAHNPPAPHAGPDRRAPTRAPRDATPVLAEALAALDRARHWPVADRVCLVADQLAARLGADVWSVSRVPPGESRLRTVRFADLRAGLTMSTDPDVYELDDYPASREAVRSGAAFHVLVDDPAADAAERAELRRQGFAELLAAGAPAPRGDFLAELFGAERLLGAARAEAALRLLVREAVAHGTR